MSDGIGSTGFSPLNSGAALRAELIRLRGSDARPLSARDTADLGDFQRSLRTALQANRDTGRQTVTARQPDREPPPRVQTAARQLLDDVAQDDRAQQPVRGSVLDIIV